MKVLSIDVGIINLGYVYIETEDFVKFNVLEVNRFDITYFTHEIISIQECKLNHDYCLVDYVNHFLQEKKEIFDATDVLLIERQPPGGITSVQDLIMNSYRNKSILVSPNEVHKFHYMRHLNYDQRKERSVEIAKKHLSLFKTFNSRVRKHDMADALLMLLMYLHKLKIKNDNIIKKIQVRESKCSKITDLEKFRFIKK